MAAQFLGLGLSAAVPLIQNYDTIYDKSKQKVKKVPIPGRKNRNNQDRDPDSMDDYDRPPRRSFSDRPRDSRGPPRGYYDDQAVASRNPQSNGNRDAYRPREASVEEIPRAFPPPNRVYAQRGGRARSVGGRDERRDYRQRGGRGHESSSDSESSISPGPRNRRRGPSLSQKDAAALAAGAYIGANPPPNRERGLDRRSGNYGPPTSTTATSTGNSKEDDDSSVDNSSDSSSVLSSSEDERRTKKIRGKELLTIGLATVATVHAASGVYASMESRDKRYEQVRNGELTPEQAQKEKNKNRLQDVAAIGIAALGIKGAYGKWQGAHATHKGYREHKEQKKQRHEKRVRKGKARNSSPPPQRPSYGRGDKSYRASEPDLSRGARDRDRDSGPPRYNDGNPYGTYGGR